MYVYMYIYIKAYMYMYEYIYIHTSQTHLRSRMQCPKQYAVSYACDPLIRIRMTSYAHLSRAPSGAGGTVPQATRCFCSGISSRCGHPRCQGTHTI